MGIFRDSSPEQNEARKKELSKELADRGFTGQAVPTAERKVRNEAADRKKQSVIEGFLSPQKVEAAAKSNEEKAAREQNGMSETQITEAEGTEQRRRRRLRRKQRG